MRAKLARIALVAVSIGAGCVIKEREIVREVCCDGGCPDGALEDASIDAPADAEPEATVDAAPDGSLDGALDGAADTGADDTASDGADAPDEGTDVATDASDACAPPSAEWHVAPSGDDTDGNGSIGCPFKTIARAVTAVAAADVDAKITVHHASGAATYGDGCTGGAPCDTTPITVPATIAKPLLIRGDGATSDVIVTGAGTSVFLVHASNVSFEAMTVRPTKTGTANAGGHGFVFDATVGSLPQAVDVTVEGPTATDATPGMGTAVLLRNKAQLRMLRGILLKGGYHAVRVEDGAFGLFNGTKAADVVARDSGAACVKVVGASPTSGAGFNVDVVGPAGAAVIEDCGPEGGLVVENGYTAIYGLLVTRTGSNVFPGLRARAGGSPSFDGEIRGLGTDGVVVESGGAATISGKVSSNAGAGIRILSGGSGTAHGAIRANGGDGVRCEDGGTVSVSEASFALNGGSGVAIAPTCTPKLGINVAFSKTSEKNAGAGLCVLGTPTVSVSYATFSCGYAGAGCGAGTPTRVTSATCAAGADISAPAGATITTPSHQCCN